MKKKHKHSTPVDKNLERIRTINDALESDPVDIETLRHLAIHGGLVNNALRALVWPKLLGVSSDNAIISKKVSSKDVDQVAKDVDRSLWKFTQGKAYMRQEKRAELSRIIHAILATHPELHYYQGFHDVASVFLLIAGEENAFAMVERLSLYHIRDALDATLESTKQVLSLMLLLSLADPELHRYFKQSEVEPFFALSWVITWFSHSFDNLDSIARLFDLFIASHPLMPLYVGVAIILHFREKLLREVDCEYSAVHTFLCNVPQDIPLEPIINKALELFDKFPPDKLQKRAFKLKNTSPANNYPFDWMTKSQRPDTVKSRAFSSHGNRINADVNSLDKEIMHILNLRHTRLKPRHKIGW
eukprot:CAMPEP_0168553946 /NCGR_PEP_ID=MMETSP0413-20121227/7516_1 /TAXON_ID=136452 /ORGANISM="Filamoeba nolandi, Strain NC-AS-23-1" /LENGTH=358 /DNA_ID=CAMNT_0008584651 /DNA_START=132 /DNA_END=1205 /DNA_ORIENTATION=-